MQMDLKKLMLKDWQRLTEWNADGPEEVDADGLAEADAEVIYTGHHSGGRKSRWT
jgi:hypothetical protein